MRSAQVLWNGEPAGLLTEHNRSHYEFRYLDTWLADPANPSISLTLPRSQAVHTSEHLFAFFYNMLSEGVNRQLQHRLLKVDEKDHFGLLMATSSKDSIGAVTLKSLNEDEDA